MAAVLKKLVALVSAENLELCTATVQYSLPNFSESNCVLTTCYVFLGFLSKSRLLCSHIQNLFQGFYSVFETWGISKVNILLLAFEKKYPKSI